MFTNSTSNSSPQISNKAISPLVPSDTPRVNENFGRIVHFIRYSNYPPPAHAHGNMVCAPIDFSIQSPAVTPAFTKGLSLPVDDEQTISLPAPGDFLYAPINSDETLTGRVFRSTDPGEMTWQLMSTTAVAAQQAQRALITPAAKTKPTLPPVKSLASLPQRPSPIPTPEIPPVPCQFVPVYTPPSPEREKEWTDCCDEAKAAAQKGKFEAAEKLLLQALEISGQFHNRDPRLPQTLDRLTNLYYNRGEYDKAQAFALETLEKTRNVYGHMHSKVASCMNNIAGIYFCQNLHHRAEPFCIEVLEIYQNIYEEDHADIGMAHNNLGFLYHAQGNFELAKMHYEAALPIRRHALGCHHPSVRLLVDGYTELLEKMGEHAQAQFIRATKSDTESGWNLFSKQVIAPKYAS